MTPPKILRILHLEDDPADAEIIRESLPAGAFDIRVVHAKTDFERTIKDWAPDVILSDYNLPAFSGLDALESVRKSGSDIPFIFVSGTIGEDRAVEVLRRGATDYVLKDRLARLPSAIARSMAGQEERRKRIAAERALNDIADTIREAFWILSPDRQKVLYANAAFERIWGRPLSWILEKPPLSLLESMHPEDRPRALECFSHLGEKDIEGEYRIQRPDGATRSVRFLWYVARDREGKIERLIGTAEDVTEARRLQEQFLQAQKMEAVGRLAGGVAHDFNNLLTIIAGYADLSLAKLDAQDPVRDMVREIRDAGDRAAHLTRQLLAFSRKQPMQLKTLDFGRIVGDMDRMLRRLIADDIELIATPARDLWAIEADRGQIEQIIVNLVVNARDALPAGGKISIGLENVEIPPGASIGLDPVQRPGRYVRLSVADNGVGMSPEIQRHLFEPFFTTKELGKGTGLGLSTVHGIVRQNGGYIDAQSAVGKGSTFRVFLPRASEDKDAGNDLRIRKAAPAGATGGETILVVDDSEMLRRLCEEILKSAHYRVLVAPDGTAAMRVLENPETPVRLMLSDLMMPGMGGSELLNQAVKVRKGLRILLMSGYAVDTPEGAGAALHGVTCMAKPFTREGLLAKVREVLDA